MLLERMIDILVNQGVLGIIAAWFMFRIEKKLERIAAVLEIVNEQHSRK